MKSVVFAMIALFTSLVVVAWTADEPTGFRNTPWGSPWSPAGFRALPGCENQGAILTFVGNAFVEVHHTECVDYKMAEEVRTNLLLTYSDVKMGSLEGSQIALRSLAFQRSWGLSASQRASARRGRHPREAASLEWRRWPALP